MRDHRSLLDRLKAHAEKDIYPLHMPGHKRNAALCGPDLPWSLDITEIGDFDDLHAAEGILQEGMERAAALYGSDRAFYLVNGSSGGILAGVRACVKRGDTVLIARNCHRSVYHSLELNGLMPVYLEPTVDDMSGILGSITPAHVRAALEKHPDARLCVITSPTYEGVVSDVRGIAGALHDKQLPLLVDEAHGAHFGFSLAFPESAVTCGADIVVQSVHKTLSGLTQTALLHVCGNIVSADEIARQLMIFETSSPSYVLMTSIDECVRRMEREGAALMNGYSAQLSAFDDAVRGLTHLRVLCYGHDAIKNHPAFGGFDPGKIVISTRGTALTGRALFDLLRNEYGLQLEMASTDYVLAMTSPFDTEEGLVRLARALLAIDASVRPSENPGFPAALPPAPEQVLPIDEALAKNRRAVPVKDCAGAVCAEYVWAYPPGIPILTPGQRVTEDCLAAIARLFSSGVSLYSTSGALPGELMAADASSRNR